MLPTTIVFGFTHNFYCDACFVLQKLIVKKLSPKKKYEKHKKRVLILSVFFCRELSFKKCSSATVHYDLINFIGLDKQKWSA